MSFVINRHGFCWIKQICTSDQVVFQKKKKKKG